MGRTFPFSLTTGVKGADRPLAEREVSSHSLLSPPAEGRAKENGKALINERATKSDEGRRIVRDVFAHIYYWCSICDNIRCIFRDIFKWELIDIKAS
jgi:hypothetical protein